MDEKPQIRTRWSVSPSPISRQLQLYQSHLAVGCSNQHVPAVGGECHAGHDICRSQHTDALAILDQIPQTNRTVLGYPFAVACLHLAADRSGEAAVGSEGDATHRLRVFLETLQLLASPQVP